MSLLEIKHSVKLNNLDTCGKSGKRNTFGVSTIIKRITETDIERKRAELLKTQINSMQMQVPTVHVNVVLNTLPNTSRQELETVNTIRMSKDIVINYSDFNTETPKKKKGKAVNKHNTTTRIDYVKTDKVIMKALEKRNMDVPKYAIG